MANYKNQKYIFTPEMDERIRKVYEDRVGMKRNKHKGPVKALADKFGMPGWRVSRRAIELDLLPVQKKEPIWSDTEKFILKRSAHRSLQVVQKYLRLAGYHRTQQGIKLKRKRMHLSRVTMEGYTARQLSRQFGVDAHSIARWISKGWLKAQRRGTARTPQQGGDEWFIRHEWVREFVIANVAVIDFRKLDKYWLVEILTEVDRLPFAVNRSEGDTSEITEPEDDYGDDPGEEYAVPLELVEGVGY